MKLLLVEAVLEGYGRVKDGSMKLKFGTMREMSTSELTNVDSYYQQKGFLAFKSDELDITDLPKENTLIDGQKSRSQLLRQKIIALHFKNGGTREGITAYYEKWMDKFDQAVQNKLDEFEN